MPFTKLWLFFIFVPSKMICNIATHQSGCIRIQAILLIRPTPKPTGCLTMVNSIFFSLNHSHPVNRQTNQFSTGMIRNNYTKQVAFVTKYMYHKSILLEERKESVRHT